MHGNVWDAGRGRTSCERRGLWKRSGSARSGFGIWGCGLLAFKAVKFRMEGAPPCTRCALLNGREWGALKAGRQERCRLRGEEENGNRNLQTTGAAGVCQGNCQAVCLCLYGTVMTGKYAARQGRGMLASCQYRSCTQYALRRTS